MKKTIRSGTREVIHNVFMRTLSEQRCGKLLTALEDVYKRTADLTDEDVDRVFLHGSPLPVLLIVGAYLLFVLKIGPEFMKNRKPFKLRNIMLFYNIFQVVFCAELLKRVIQHYMEAGFWNDACLSLSEKYRPLIIHGSQLYLIGKIIDFMDTVFFVLRKKNSQISFLHVYHHASMVVIVYLANKFALSENYLFGGGLNTFVHIVMYSYYALSSLGPEVAKYLWWKKYLTKLQLVQFVLIITDLSIREYRSICPRQKLIFTLSIWQAVVFIILFSNFYIKAYKKQNENTKPIDSVNNKCDTVNGTKATLKVKEK